MRLFIAVDLPKEVIAESIRIKSILPWKGLSKPENCHLTLKFLGEAEDIKLPLIKELLKKIKKKSFSLSTKSLGIFPNENYIKVIWMSTDNNKKIFELQNAIEESLIQLGFKKDNEFHPHITLARVKFLPNKNELINLIKSINVKSLEIPITKFILYQSVLKRGPPEYIPLLKVKLN